MINKRQLFLGTTALALTLNATSTLAATEASAPQSAPFPLDKVRLLPSIWQDAVTTNVAYLKSLEPDRLLHNFHLSASLPPKAKLYGGWEGMGIAGHTLGHYLSACALAYAQTGDADLRARLDYTIGEMSLIQKAHKDGYIGGTTVDREGKTIDGKVVFEEVRQGVITSHGFDLNGGWVPLYTWHKVHAGLLDVHTYTHDPRALNIAVAMSDYLIGVLGHLDDPQIQQVLAAEHGGLNETFAETYARTGQKRFLDMAKRLYHKEVLEPLAQGKDQLAGKHANTQIPKVIGLARLYELTQEPHYRDASRFFWERVTKHHSFVIGGNSTAEHFGEPDQLSNRIDDKTCEACNSYNMLKLTRHLYQWQPNAAWFDFYERAHLNHIMAHQDPKTGAFVYFMPLSSGSSRLYSTPENSFWCCVGSGMESHAKHGDSIYWHAKDTLFVNLYIPSELDWSAKKTRVTLRGDILGEAPIGLSFSNPKPTYFTLALRLPSWCERPTLRVNGAIEPILQRDGYALLSRKWSSTDKIELTLPHSLRTESPQDNPNLVAFLKGPLVLAGDLGSAEGDAPFPPVLVSETAMSGFDTRAMTVQTKPQSLNMVPFFSQYQRRSTVYFPLFSEAQWTIKKSVWEKEQADRLSLNSRTIDVIRLGEMQPERDHGFETDLAEPTSRLGRSGRWLMWSSDKSFSFDLKAPPKDGLLRVTYWGNDIYKRFDIFINDRLLKSETLEVPGLDGFRTLDYALSPEDTKRETLRVRFVTRGSDVAVFEVRSLKP